MYHVIERRWTGITYETVHTYATVETLSEARKIEQTMTQSLVALHTPDVILGDRVVAVRDDDYRIV